MSPFWKEVRFARKWGAVFFFPLAAIVGLNVYAKLEWGALLLPQPVFAVTLALLVPATILFIFGGILRPVWARMMAFYLRGNPAFRARASRNGLFLWVYGCNADGSSSLDNE